MSQRIGARVHCVVEAEVHGSDGLTLDLIMDRLRRSGSVDGYGLSTEAYRRAIEEELKVQQGGARDPSGGAVDGGLLPADAPPPAPPAPSPPPVPTPADMRPYTEMRVEEVVRLVYEPDSKVR